MKLDKSSHIYGIFRLLSGMRIIGILFLMCLAQVILAQGESSPDYMRSIGKIYVVAAVCWVILLTILAYLVILDRKISRLEKRQKNE